MGEDTKLLDMWYVSDNNNVPPISILQPIDTHLKHFLNKKEPTFQAKDAAAWWKIQSKLQGRDKVNIVNLSIMMHTFQKS